MRNHRTARIKCLSVVGKVGSKCRKSNCHLEKARLDIHGRCVLFVSRSMRRTSYILTAANLKKKMHQWHLIFLVGPSKIILHLFNALRKIQTKAYLVRQQLVLKPQLSL